MYFTGSKAGRGICRGVFRIFLFQWYIFLIMEGGQGLWDVYGLWIHKEFVIIRKTNGNNWELLLNIKSPPGGVAL
jgi:hypothetical protein